MQPQQLARLQVEIEEMKRIPGLRSFELFKDDRYSDGDWRRVLWRGKAPTGHVIEARYPSSYPHAPLFITTTPKVPTHHYYDSGGLCVMRPGEWSPDFSAATNITIAFRFLDDVRCGRVRD